VAVPKGKTRITIRLDEDVVAWFKEQVHRAGGGSYQSLINAALRDHVRYAGEPRAGGGSYQSLINAALRDHVRYAGEPLEDTLRRVLREELAPGG
jgi:uncharacterized protein (DUF4415 family)